MWLHKGLSKPDVVDYCDGKIPFLEFGKKYVFENMNVLIFGKTKSVCGCLSLIKHTVLFT